MRNEKLKMRSERDVSEIAVRFESVSFGYGDEPVLENASFHIHRGEFAALAGPNGSGKTTVLKLMLGLEKPGSGRITLFGIEQGQNSTWRGKLGYVPQSPPSDMAFPASVRDVVRMGLLHPSRRYGKKNRPAVDRALEQAGIADLAEKPWRALSGGQRRRVLVARALAAQPEILVLDEPTANMDVESETRFFEVLGKLKGNATILIVTHEMNFVSALTDRVFCLGGEDHKRHGIVQHKTETFKSSPLNLASRILHGENISPDDCCRH